MQHQLLRSSFLQDQFLRPPLFRVVPVPKTPFFDSCPCLRPPPPFVGGGVCPCLRPPFLGLCPCLIPPFSMCRGTPPPVYIESAPPPLPPGSRPIPEVLRRSGVTCTSISVKYNVCASPIHRPIIDSSNNVLIFNVKVGFIALNR